MPRNFRPGQRAELYVVDVTTGEHRLVNTSSTLLFEAPNWTSDGDWLVVNGDGRLFRIPATSDQPPEQIEPEQIEPEQIDLGGLPSINNDHVLSPDGTTVYVSADDGHLYAVPMTGGSPRRVTNDRGPGFHHYLHGISPDGSTLAYIGLMNHTDGRRITNIYTIPSAGGEDVQITNDEYADDGSEFGPDGKWIYFNSERASTLPGHAQLFRVSVTGHALEQLTHDERVNWFPHPSPDGSTVAYVSFPAGTLGHPADIDDVQLRLLDADGRIREVATIFGGQGTMNVPSWSPDSTRLAYVAYPIS
ncbi:MAG TPA: biopolymer transporter Tol [Kribbella sp.]